MAFQLLPVNKNVLEVTIDELLSGNQRYDPAEYQTDMDILMDDCNSYEKRVIFDMVRALKVSLRENACLIGKDESF